LAARRPSRNPPPPAAPPPGPPPVGRGKERAGHHRRPQALAPPERPVGLDGGAEERPAGQPTSRRYDQATPPARVRTPGCVGDHEAGVEHGNAEMPLETE